MRSYIEAQLRELAKLIDVVVADDALMSAIEQSATVCETALRNGNKLLLAGNGGSAADSQHIAAEFVSRFLYDRPGLPAIALTTDTSALTAIGNDYGYEQLFARQLQALARPGDVFIGISTSGASPNVIAALRMARSLKVTTVGFSGHSGGAMNELCDVMINVPSSKTSKIQEIHIAVGHIICGIVERSLFPR